MNYSSAKEISVAICYRLEPFTDKLNIAGSIRRGKPEVKDIEICCLPKLVVGGADSLFDEGTRYYMIDPQFVQIVNTLGNIIKGKPDGRYMQIALPEGINLDLFIPQPHDYYRQYAIRTGSADYSAKIIAGGWKAKGWCGTDEGLRKISQCTEKQLPGSKNGSKSKWIPQPNADKPPVWQSEQEFFEWLGVPYLKPVMRFVM